MTNDLLTAQDYGLHSPDVSTMETTNLLLQQLIREIRKTHPSQRCVLALDWSNPAKVLDNKNDTVRIRFLASGKPVKSQHLVISNGTSVALSVGLNGPAVQYSGGTSGGPLHVEPVTTVQIPAEIEFIEIQAQASNATGQHIVINNDPTGLASIGLIGVYAWTIPNSDKDQTE